MSSSLEGTSRAGHDPATEDDYVRIQQSEKFQELRRRHRSVVFPLAAVFLAWYFVYVLLADYAHDFMSTKIGGSNITVGLIMGLLQFVSTFIITTVYVRLANKNLDPIAKEIREEIEGADR
ncbi:MAG: hypothetical protein QOE19_2127 [Actinomycetota bacterium]|nr:hypothetical protein [Actinomycetota bacterium]MDQ1666282.1 hypothetical protein [Actinomycetota bacterium]